MSIIAATDGETVPDRAVEVAAELAAQYGDELVVLHVIPEDTFEKQRKASGDGASNPTFSIAPEITYRQFGDQTRGGSDNRYTLEDAQQDAAIAAEEVTEESVGDVDAVSFQGRVGEPAAEILDLASREEARYVVIGGRKRSPVGKALFGSVTQSVLLEADRPVVTVMEAEA